MDNVSTGKLTWALLLILLGAAGGYFFGFDIGFERGVEQTVEESEVSVLPPAEDETDTEEPETPLLPGGEQVETVSCTTNSQCGAREYCAQFTGQCGEEGACMARPEACTLQYDPVCGCDGQTYGNACAAASAGVSVASEGECAS